MCFILQLKSLTNRDTSAFLKPAILHVACATLLAPDVFVTFDSRQRTLARHAGLQAPDLS